MRKLILFLLLIISALITFAQETPPPSQYLKAVNGQFYMDTRDSSVWQFMGSPFGWQKKARFKDVVPFDPRFTSDLTVYLPSGYTFGKYVNGSVIPSTGKTAAQVIADAIVVAIPPTYIAPTASITSNPSPGTFEIGSTINTTLSSTFTRNDAGSQSSVTYYRGTTALSGNTDVITSLTTATTYKVTFAYSQGTCKANNLGATDCNGHINAGSVTSSNITYTPLPKLYVGTCTGTAPTSSEILAATGGTTAFTSARAYNMTVTFTGSNLHVFYAYPASLGVVTSAKDQAGNQVIGAYTITTQSLTNAAGYTQNYTVATSNNTYSNTSIYTTFL